MKKQTEKGRIFNPDARVNIDTAADVASVLIADEIKRFAEDKPLDRHHIMKVRLKSGVNLGELFTKYVNDDRWDNFTSGTPRHVLQDLEQEVKAMLIEISESIKDKL